MEEIWKDIEGYEGLYQVSNYGRVRSLPRVSKSINKTYGGKILKLGHLDKTKHQTVTLSKDNILKTYPLHRIVADAFIPNPDNLPCINHKDEDPTNNHIDNLEWCSYQYNINYSLYKRKRKIICIETGEILYASEWSKKFNTHKNSIYTHLNGNNENFKGLHFKYVD